jgi:hypothetical protein
MILQNSRAASKIFTVSFVVAVFVLFFISSLSYRQLKSLTETEQLVSHTYKVQILLEQLFSLTKDAETGQRGFVITKDSAFLQPYFNSRVKIDSIYDQLRILTKDNVAEQQNLDQLKPIINRRFELLADRLDEFSDTSNLNTDLYKAKMFAGKVVMDMLRLQLNKMIAEETSLLEERQKLHSSKLYITPFFSLLLLFFSLAIFIAAFYKINSDVKKLKELNNELILTKGSFEHAEEIANISHWEWNLDTNQLTYSDNQYLLLGCQPGEFEPTIENYLKYIHPDDRHIITSGGQKALVQKQPSEAIFRVIRKDGVLRYFKSTGKMLTDDIGKKIIIGINYDITEQYLASKTLEDKNSELLRSNIELASFNHVASHDLQEPLRKIQMFISRIYDDKELNLSERNKDYFNRIQSSASRMQVLIDDLLAYSRVNGTDKIFERVDMNDILETVLYEMIQAQIIDEKKVKIKYAKLPDIQGIPFQLKQLFTNLIENSLKYSDPSRPPVIDIRSVVVTGTDVPNARADINRKYNKISVTDNGMGFEQEYAEKIFSLFQRLHDKLTFSGTGIGLAICKKVVENHHGFITAKGVPGKGATFEIYLPVYI